MRRIALPRFMPIIFMLLTIALIVAGIASLGKVFLSSESKKEVTDNSQTQLVSTSSSASVRMNVRGPIVATENFRGFSITVAPQARQLSVYSGYNLNVLSQTNLTNVPSGYEQFVYALKNLKLAEGNELVGEKNDTRGVCPTGILYEFAILDNNKSVKTLWTTNCASYKGSLKANRSELYNLFMAQIPNSSTIISPYNLN